jgi:hypothetical protein
LCVSCASPIRHAESAVALYRRRKRTTTTIVDGATLTGGVLTDAASVTGAAGPTVIAISGIQAVQRAPIATPTLDGWGLLVLMLALLGFALRKSVTGKPWSREGEAAFTPARSLSRKQRRRPLPVRCRE